MAEAGFVAAFAAGILTLLAPCSALLLPAFFANAFTSSTQLLGRTLLFLLGLATVFIPLGLGASLVASLLIDYRETTILVAGLVMIAFGVMEIVGGGFSLVPAGWMGRFGGGRGATAIYATGLLYGVSGFCTGPLLGAVLAIAATSPNPLLGGALLFTYALGTAAPLFLIAWLWDRYGLGRRPWLRGRPLRIGPVEIHSTRLVSGALFILLGAVFITLQGSSGLGGIYVDLGLEEAGFRIQAWIAENGSAVPDVAWIALVLLVGALWWARRRTTESIAPDPAPPTSAKPVTMEQP